MNREAFDVLVHNTITATADLLIAKGAEYAGDADRLANFKRNAEKQGTTALQIWKQYIGKHLDSVDTYVRRVHDEALKQSILDLVGTHTYAELTEKSTDYIVSDIRYRMTRNMTNAMSEIDKQLSEPIEGRFHDVINYCFLGLALIKETRDGAA